jgi:hypothetical protein
VSALALPERAKALTTNSYELSPFVVSALALPERAKALTTNGYELSWN